MPILLQRLESKLILNIVCKQISERVPSAPLITVHDCIYTTERYADELTSIMRDTITQHIGIVPGIKFEVQNDIETMNSLKETALQDYNSMIQRNITTKKRKKEQLFDEPLAKPSPPVLFEMPEHNGERILSTRYTNIEETSLGESRPHHSRTFCDINELPADS